MAKFLIVTVCVALVGVLAEPPAPSNYLPPQARNSLSRSYGAPEQQGYSNGFGARSGSGSRSYNSIAESQFGGSSRARFGGSAPQQQYGAPAGNNFDDTVVTNARFAPSRQTGASFGAPAPRFGSINNNNQFNAPSFRQQSAPQFNAPSFRQQSAPQFNSRQQPTSSYAAAARQQPSSQYGAPSTEYGAPFARKMDDDLAEPANYEFNYQVKDEENPDGAEFGHQETREDDSARGEYRVVLPDGRMQIVEYEADEEGFRPRIRYEEIGYPAARDNNQGPY